MRECHPPIGDNIVHLASPGGHASWQKRSPNSVLFASAFCPANRQELAECVPNLVETFRKLNEFFATPSFAK
jgi:hypothetical protein